MAFTRNDLATLEESIASGILTVRYEDRTVTYQSTASMIEARRLIARELDAAAGKKPRKRVIRLFQSGRGL